MSLFAVVLSHAYIHKLWLDQANVLTNALLAIILHKITLNIITLDDTKYIKL
jgi:hypothetical protein